MFLSEFSIKKTILSLLFLNLLSGVYIHAMNSKEALAALGLNEGATTEQITKAYRTLARKNHPDLSQGSKTAETLMQTINEARDYLIKVPIEELRDQEDMQNFLWEELRRAAQNQKEMRAQYEQKRAAYQRAQNFELAGQILACIGIPFIAKSIEQMYNEYHASENKDKTWKEIFPPKSYIPLAVGTVSTIAAILCMRQAALIEKSL